jgi:hypothetical protein
VTAIFHADLKRLYLAGELWRLVLLYWFCCSDNIKPQFLSQKSPE